MINYPLHPYKLAGFASIAAATVGEHVHHAATLLVAAGRFGEFGASGGRVGRV